MKRIKCQGKRNGKHCSYFSFAWIIHEFNRKDAKRLPGKELKLYRSLTLRLSKFIVCQQLDVDSVEGEL